MFRGGEYGEGIGGVSVAGEGLEADREREKGRSGKR